MILVDTSVWIEVFRARRPLDLEAAADFDDVVTCLPIVQEVLQGFREEHAYRRARSAMLSLPIVESPKVVIVDMNVEGGEETAQLVKEAGGESILVHADVSKSADAQRMVDNALEAYGRLDCTFNNAGVSGRTRNLTADYSEDEWDRIIDINLKGDPLSEREPD